MRMFLGYKERIFKMIKPTKRKVKKIAKKLRNPMYSRGTYSSKEEYYKDEIEREIRAKSRINIASSDGKFRILGMIKKRKNDYIVEVEDKYGLAAVVTFKAEDVIEDDYESATFTLK